MSALQTLGLLAYKIFNGYAPEKGPRVIKAAIDFSVLNPYPFDLSIAQETDQLEFVQSIYVDNSLNPNALTITIRHGTQQVLTWPAFSQGFLPAMSPNPPKFNAATVGTPIVNIWLLNVPMPAMIWQSGATQVQQSGSTGQDFSANAPANSANLLATVPVNALRNSIEVQNQSAEQIQVVLDDGAGNNVSRLLLAPGTGANTQGGDWQSFTFKGRVRIFGATAADQVFVHQD
jgi:hypothetical protein